MEAITHFIQEGFSFIGPFFILLGVLVFVHEFGHFLVAKYCGVRVEVFSLGFGKRIMQFHRGDTIYCISIIPLGGYVKMYGDDPGAQIPEEEKAHSFLHKKVGQRIAIVLAGPLMNFFLAIFLFMGVAMLGQQVTSSQLGDISPESEAFQAGFRSGDHIRFINETATTTWSETEKIIRAHVEKPLNFTVENLQTGKREFQATPSLIPNDDLFSWSKEVGGFKGLSLASRAPLVGVPDRDSVAARAGLQSLDLITHINGQEISYWRHVGLRLFEEAQKGEEIVLRIRPYIHGKETEPRDVSIKGWMPPSPDLATAELGIETTALYLLQVVKESPAAKAGLQRGDKIISIQGKPTAKWEDVLTNVKGFKPSQNESLEFMILRGGETQSFSIQPQVTEHMNSQLQDEKRFTVGIVSASTAVRSPPTLQVTSHPIKAFYEGVEQSLQWTNFVVISLVRLVKNEISPRNISSVITIGKVAGQSFKVGISPFLKIMAIISINLFLVNLLPIPILDGGHLMFFTIEALRGAPISLRKMEMAQQIGLIIMMALMAYALFNDVNNHFNPPW